VIAGRLSSAYSASGESIPNRYFTPSDSSVCANAPAVDVAVEVAGTSVGGLIWETGIVHLRVQLRALGPRLDGAAAQDQACRLEASARTTSLIPCLARLSIV
jgi:hypothetical protein